MDFWSNFKSEVNRFWAQNDQISAFLPQPTWSSDKKTWLAVPKMDRKSFSSFVLGSKNIKITKTDQVQEFWPHEGENIPSNDHTVLLLWSNQGFLSIFLLSLDFHYFHRQKKKALWSISMTNQAKSKKIMMFSWIPYMIC